MTEYNSGVPTSRTSPPWGQLWIQASNADVAFCHALYHRSRRDAKLPHEYQEGMAEERAERYRAALLAIEEAARGERELLPPEPEPPVMPEEKVAGDYHKGSGA